MIYFNFARHSFILLNASFRLSSEAAKEILMQFGAPNASPPTLDTNTSLRICIERSEAFSSFSPPAVVLPKYALTSGKA